MLFFSLLAVNAPALLPLVPCAAAGRSGRHGFCTSSAAGTGTSTATAAPTPIILRGSNYIRLGGDDGSLYHSTFDMCAVNCYNRTRFLAAFDAMQRNGYNINRVFLDARPGIGIGGNTTSTGDLFIRRIYFVTRFSTKFNVIINVGFQSRWMRHGSGVSRSTLPTVQCVEFTRWSRWCAFRRISILRTSSRRTEVRSGQSGRSHRGINFW